MGLKWRIDQRGQIDPLVFRVSILALALKGLIKCNICYARYENILGEADFTPCPG